MKTTTSYGYEASSLEDIALVFDTNIKHAEARQNAYRATPTTIKKLAIEIEIWRQAAAILRLTTLTS